MKKQKTWKNYVNKTNTVENTWKNNEQTMNNEQLLKN